MRLLWWLLLVSLVIGSMERRGFGLMVKRLEMSFLELDVVWVLSALGHGSERVIARQLKHNNVKLRSRRQLQYILERMESDGLVLHDCADGVWVWNYDAASVWVKQVLVLTERLHEKARQTKDQVDVRGSPVYRWAKIKRGS